MDHILFVNSLAYGHLDCFHLMVVGNRAAVNICVQIFV